MNIRRGAARSASSSPDPLYVCRRILVVSLMAMFLVALWSIPLRAGVSDGVDGLSLYCQMANPATFRDSSQFSHFERAHALTLWLEAVKSMPASLRQDMGAADLVRAARPYSDEVVLLGVDPGELQQPPETWALRPGHATPLSDGALDAWAWEHDAAVKAFWTDPASPVLRLAARCESSTQPGSRRSRPVLAMALDDWSPSLRAVDFLSRSPGDLSPVALASPPAGPAGDVSLVPSWGPGPSTVPEAVLDSLPESAMLPVTAVSVPAPVSPRGPSGLLSLAPLHAHGQPLLVRYGDAFRVSGLHGEWQARTTRMLGDLPGSGESYRETPAARSFLRLAVRGTHDLLGPVAAMNGLEVSPRDWQAVAGVPFGSAHQALAAKNWAVQGAGVELRASSRLGVALRLDEVAAFRGIEALTLGGPGPNLRMQGAGVNLNYSVTENLRLQGGYIYQRTQGLYLPSLSATPSGAFSLVDERAYPYVGFNYRFNDDARWNFNVRFYNPADLGQGSMARTQPSLYDPKVTTELRLRF